MDTTTSTGRRCPHQQGEHYLGDAGDTGALQEVTERPNVPATSSKVLDLQAIG